MSWAGFKKNVNRATTQVMMKTGHVEKTNDRDYEVEERRFRTMEAAATRLQKEARGYLDSLRGMCQAPINDPLTWQGQPVVASVAENPILC